MDRSIRVGSWEMISAMLISGTIGWFVFVSNVAVVQVVFWRCVIGSVMLAGICKAFGYLKRDFLSPPRIALAVLSGIAIVANWLMLFASYSKASIAISTAVYNVQPFLLVMLASLFLKEKITAPKLGWLTLAFLGVLAIVAAHADNRTGDDYLLGVLLATGAAFFYAVAALLIKRLQGMPPHLIALIQVISGAILLAPFMFDQSIPASGMSWAALASLGVVHTGLMYILLYGAIQKLPTALTGALSFIYPIAAIGVDWIAFDHRLGLLQWVGVAVILFAALGMQRGWGSSLVPRPEIEVSR